jgi:hypothetical protein
MGAISKPSQAFYEGARFYAAFIYSRSRPSRFFTRFISILRTTLKSASTREVAI